MDILNIITINGIQCVTVNDAARMIGIATKTVRTQLAAGKLEAVNTAGYHTYITVASVERYKEEYAGQVGKYPRKVANS